MEIVKVKRPWGKFERYALNKKCTVKVLEVRPFKRLSLQSHKHRDEFWKILSGKAVVTIGEKRKSADEGKMFLLKKGTKHRIEAKSKKVVFLEISFGDFDEHDEVRYDDDYGRK